MLMIVNTANFLCFGPTAAYMYMYIISKEGCCKKEVMWCVGNFEFEPVYIKEVMATFLRVN